MILTAIHSVCFGKREAAVKDKAGRTEKPSKTPPQRGVKTDSFITQAEANTAYTFSETLPTGMNMVVPLPQQTDDSELFPRLMFCKLSPAAQEWVNNTTGYIQWAFSQWQKGQETPGSALVPLASQAKPGHDNLPQVKRPTWFVTTAPWDSSDPNFTPMVAIPGSPELEQNPVLQALHLQDVPTLTWAEETGQAQEFSGPIYGNLFLYAENDAGDQRFTPCQAIDVSDKEADKFEAKMNTVQEQAWIETTPIYTDEPDDFGDSLSGEGFPKTVSKINLTEH